MSLLLISVCRSLLVAMVIHPKVHLKFIFPPIVGLDPGATKLDNVARQHLDILRTQINAREGFEIEQEVHAHVEEQDSFLDQQ